MAKALETPDEIRAAAMNMLEDPSPSPSDNAEPPAPAADPVEEPPAPDKVEPEPPAPNPEEPPAPEPKEGDKDWKVPGERLQKEVEKRKEAEIERDRLKAELEAKGNPPADDAPKDDPEDDDVELTPEFLKAAKKYGFTTKAEAEKLAEDKATSILAADKQATASRVQAQQDKQDLTTEFKDKGYPEFKIDEVLPEAIKMVGEKNISKGVLRAAYLEKNSGAIEDILVKQAAAKSTAPTASAERPGGAPKLGTGEEVAKTPEQRTKENIAAAIE